MFFKDLARPYSLVPRNGTCGTVRVGRVGFACGRPGPGQGSGTFVDSFVGSHTETHVANDACGGACPCGALPSGDGAVRRLQGPTLER